MIVNFLTKTGSFLRTDHTLISVMFIGFCVAVMILLSINSVHAGLVGTNPRASLLNGSTAILPCHYTVSTYGVYWKKENGLSDPAGDTIIHLDTYFNVGERSGRGVDEGRFYISDDFSLIISPVMVKDEGRYSCKVSDVSTGMTYSNSTEVTVSATHVPAGRVWTKPRASLSNGSTAFLPCHYTRRTIGVYWTKENGHSEHGGDTIVHLDTYFNVGERSGRGLDEGRFNISDDFSLVISPVLLTDKGRYSCEVSDVSTGNTYSNSTEVTVSATQLPAGQVGTKPRASLSNGSKAILPCHYTLRTFGVYWKKENGHWEPEGDIIAHLDTFFNVGERSGLGLDEGRFNISDDFSLVISPVIVTDEGRYSCKVSDLTTGIAYSNSTDVTVFVYAREPYVNVKPCEHSALGNQSEDLMETRCTYYIFKNQTSFQIDCSVSGVKPYVSLTWETNGTNVGTNYALMPTFEDRGDGTFDQNMALMGRVNETMNGTVFTCVAEGLAVNGTATSSVIFVKTEPENVEPDIPDTPNKPQVAAIVVPVVIVCLVLIAAIIIYVWKLKRKQRGSHWIPFRRRR